MCLERLCLLCVCVTSRKQKVGKLLCSTYSYPTPAQHGQIAEAIMEQLKSTVKHDCLPAAQLKASLDCYFGHLSNCMVIVSFVTVLHHSYCG